MKLVHFFVRHHAAREREAKKMRAAEDFAARASSM